MKYVVANWKMNLSLRESVALARGVLRTVQGKEKTPQVVLCPSFTSLSEVHKVLTRTRLELGAQHIGPDRAGAFTGQVGAAQLVDVGCTYAIVGHSEQRAAGEAGEMVQKRLHAALTAGITPILCVGEPQEERQAGQAEAFVKAQLASALKGLRLPREGKLMVAYEPVWAIGSGTPATPGDVVVMHGFIRATVKGLIDIADSKLCLVYGGSVDHTNAYTFLRETEVDGVLVGGASLKIHEFEAIVAAAQEVGDAQDTV